MQDPTLHDPSHLLWDLCKLVTHCRNEEALLPTYRWCERMLTLDGASLRGGPGNSLQTMESLGQIIARQLVREGRNTDARRILRSAALLKDKGGRAEMLSLLYQLMGSNDSHPTFHGSSTILNGHGPPSSTPVPSSSTSHSQRSRAGEEFPSGVSSIRRDEALGRPSSSQGVPLSSQAFPASSSSSLSHNSATRNTIRIHGEELPGLSNEKQRRSPDAEPLGAKKTSPDAELLTEILLVLQGVESRHIRWESRRQEFVLHRDFKIPLPAPKQHQLLRLCESGWVYQRVRGYCDSLGKSGGLVGEALVSALRSHLHKYLGHLTVLDQQLQSGQLTLMRLVLWMEEPREELQFLAAVATRAEGLKGGALLSLLYHFSHHGDVARQALALSLLAEACRPLRLMLTDWVVKGRLRDPYQEFFVAEDPSVKRELWWQHKYSLRERMVPEFISKDMAEKVVSSGKGINFLAEVCHEMDLLIRCGDHVHAKLLNTSLKELFLDTDGESSLRTLVSMTCKETSSRVLHVLMEKYKLLEHLTALRRYLLLGQGDFIRHLMDLLEPELSVAGTELLPYSLPSILDAAVRVTTAQFESPQVLQRLSTRIIQPMPGDIGWDVFSLSYDLDGPLAAVVTPDVHLQYQQLFCTLWRAKRMDRALTRMTQELLRAHRQLAAFPGGVPILNVELGEVFHQLHMLTAHMAHFSTQLNYYLSFDVVECGWVEAMKRLRSDSLDSPESLLLAHSNFLQSATKHAFLHPESRVIKSQLRLLYGLLEDLQTLVEGFLRPALAEKERIDAHRARTEERIRNKMYGTNEAEEAALALAWQKFLPIVEETQTKARCLLTTYEEQMSAFLLDLCSMEDVRLQDLCIRLDISGYYVSRDQKLRMSLTLAHRLSRGQLRLRADHASVPSLR